MADKNAVEEFLGMKKTAGPMSSFGQHAGRAAAGGLAAGLGAAAAGGIGLAVSKIVDAATKSHDFKQMLENNQDLHEHYSNDPKKFNLMFSTLRTMNPQFSKDPLVAGAYMRRMVMAPEGIGGMAGEALGHRRDFEQPLQEMFSKGVGEGAKSGLMDSFKQEGESRQPQQDPWSLEKQKMDYQHKLRQEPGQPKTEVTENYEEQMPNARSGGTEEEKMEGWHMPLNPSRRTVKTTR
jgi:hypothetical protein